MTSIKCRIKGGDKGLMDGRIVDFFHVALSIPHGDGEAPPFKVYAIVAHDTGELTVEDIDSLIVRQGALT